MREISKLEPIKDNPDEKPSKKRKRPIEREITAHSTAPATETALVQTFLSTLETKRGTIFSHGSDNLVEGGAQNGEGPSRPFEHKRENELSEEESKDLDTINKLNILSLQHFARYNDNLQPVLAYRKQFKDNPQQINQETKQQALKNWKALSDLSNGNLRWDQIKNNSIWKEIKAYKLLTGTRIKIDRLAPKKRKELDQVLKNLDLQALDRVVTEEIPSYLANPKISNDERMQNDLTQSMYYMKNLNTLYDANYQKEYDNAIKRELMDFVYKSHQKDAQRDISLTFLSKILNQEDQNRILALLQPDSLAEHSQAGLAEFQENETSTSTLRRQEEPSSSKRVENLTDPQETRAKQRRSFTQKKISFDSLQKRKDQGLVWDDVSQKRNSMDQGTTSSHQTLKETRQQDNQEKLTQEELDILVSEVCNTPNFRAGKFKPANEEIQRIVKKLDKTSLDTEQWEHTKMILSEKGFKSKDNSYTYFYMRTTPWKIARAAYDSKRRKDIKSDYGSKRQYENILARRDGFRNEHERASARAQEKGFRNEYDRDNARAQDQGFRNLHDRDNARAQRAGFDNKHDRNNARAQRAGFDNKHDRENARAQRAGFDNEHDRNNARAQDQGFANRYQRSKK